MKIIYEQNPLRNKVELTEFDLTIMRYKLQLNEIHEAIFDAYYKVEDINAIKNSLEEIINSEDNPESKIHKRVEHYMSFYVPELTDGMEHSGDCTKLCCSCTKCGAEDTLGINTLEGLRGLHYISGAFCDGRNLNEAIEYLKQDREYNEEWHKSNITRWEAERKSALESLIEYKNKHFGDLT